MQCPTVMREQSEEQWTKHTALKGSTAQCGKFILLKCQLHSLFHNLKFPNTFPLFFELSNKNKSYMFLHNLIYSL